MEFLETQYVSVTLVRTDAADGMDVLMPQLGETVAEGKIAKWFKAAGDAVKPGDNLFEIETDKTSMEVPATSAGTLSEIRFQVGEVAKVGAVVAVIAGGGRAGAAKALLAPQRAPPSSARPRASGGPAATAMPLATGPACAGTNGVRSRPRAIAHIDPFHEVRTPERNFGPARLAGGAFGDAAGAPARRRARHRSRRASRGSGPHGRIVARDVEKRRARRAAPRHGHRRQRRAGQGAVTRASPTRKCRSTPCAAPSPRG